MKNATSIEISILYQTQQNHLELKSLLESVLDRLGKKRPVDPQWLSIADAARLAGLSVEACQTRIRRENQKLSGFPIRRRHGAVHAADWREYLRLESSKRQRKAAVVETALAGLEVGR
jgi:hypothetical protein